ncbi:MAG: DUF4325 domain-containing protein [Candidatus Taylorbacteria bacterium]|nr:DUF4325 domain-containing protein [Candidatus Taylorbacteria bacterium]
MDINKFILNKAEKQGEITVAEAVKATGFSRAYIFRFFQELTERGKLAKVGHANRSRYVIAVDKFIKKSKKNIQSFDRVFENKNLHEDQVFNLIKSETGILDGIKENITRILEYAFTEMLNNAIEHSGSLKIKVAMKRDGGTVIFEVVDWGVGIFEKIIHVRHLLNIEEAIQDLLKGKQTTDPETHSGEGIFFTRRIADTFSIRSSTKKLFFNNIINDFTVVSIKSIFGTRVRFSIASNSKKELRNIFNQYTKNSFEFSSTEVTVRLYEKGIPTFISRSQARRILSGLEKFKTITLDFTGIVAVGQGFADEVFRVWKKKYPEIEIIIINTNEDIEFMIKRTKLELARKS